MHADPIIVASLVEFHNAAEVRAFWKQALGAYTTRSTTVIQMTSFSQDGQSSSGLALTTPAELKEFIATCIAALGELEDTDSVTPADDIASGTDFSNRRVLA